MSKIKIGAKVTAKVRPTKVTVSGTFQGYRLEDQEDPTSICGTVLHVKDGMQHLDYVYVDSIKVCESEDERIRMEIHAYLFNTLHNTQQLTPRTNELERWLAYLERQKESLHIPETCKENADSFTDVQKPAEWSEEEKKHLYNAIEAVKYVYDISEGTSGFKCVKFLKSLRPQPHWKPSKKQIDALNAIILTGSFTYVGQVQDLISLKDDLKKLM